MKIGIDISQATFEKTGVGNYLIQLIEHMVVQNTQDSFVLFFSSLRRPIPTFVKKLPKDRVSVKAFKFPPTFLDTLWNRMHILPIEKLIGKVDIFLSSDWTQPPTTKAKKATILYDLIVYKHPKETDKVIVQTQKRRLKWVKKECDIIFCISEATKKDAVEVLGIPEEKLVVLYPGVK